MGNLFMSIGIIALLALCFSINVLLGFAVLAFMLGSAFSD